MFRSGCTWKRGTGRIFYFGPGHETYPIYRHPTVKTVLKNAVRWARPEGVRWIAGAPNIPIDKAPESLTRKGGSIHRPGDEGLR